MLWLRHIILDDGTGMYITTVWTPRSYSLPTSLLAIRSCPLLKHDGSWSGWSRVRILWHYPVLSAHDRLDMALSSLAQFWMYCFTELRTLKCIYIILPWNGIGRSSSFFLWTNHDLHSDHWFLRTSVGGHGFCYHWLYAVSFRYTSYFSETPSTQYLRSYMSTTLWLSILVKRLSAFNSKADTVRILRRLCLSNWIFATGPCCIKLYVDDWTEVCADPALTVCNISLMVICPDVFSREF